jgi:hypothetical protein
MVMKTEHDAGQKGTKTSLSLMICVMIINECKGHKRTFTWVAPRAYKQINSSTILFTWNCNLAFVSTPSSKLKVLV